MRETNLRDVLMLRALEREASALPPSDALAQGLAVDLAWAGDEARRCLAAQTAAGDAQADAGSAWLAERARLGLARCAQRWGAGLPLGGLARLAAGPRRRLAGLVAVLAFGIGALSDLLGGANRINLLALPLLGLLAWNLAVYGLLAIQALGAARQRTGQTPGPLRQGLLALLARWGPGRRGPLPQAAAPVVSHGTGLAGSYLQWARVQGAFSQDWLAVTGPLQARRLAALVHVAAACLALGLVASLYTRGLVLDYRAGWDSTFLDAGGVRRLLGLLLGPAAALSGQALPDAAALAPLRLAGGAGEGAARWIHLWALTLLLWVILPRAALAGAAWLAARRLAASLPLPAGADDLRRLLLSASDAPQRVWVLPYSYQLDAARQAVLATVVGRRLGPQVALVAPPSLPLGAEDSLPAGLPDGQPAQVVLLLALTATPERESHGAMVAALQAHLARSTQLAGRCTLQVWVDESGWRQRLPGADGAERLQQRRQAWARMLAPLDAAPVFVDLGTAQAA